MKADNNTETGVTLNNIKAMSYLSIYYAYKIRGATYKKAGQTADVTEALGEAYSWWMQYTNLMDSMYNGMTMQRSEDFPHWHAHDENVLKEYQDNGGVGIPKLKK